MARNRGGSNATAPTPSVRKNASKQASTKQSKKRKNSERPSKLSPKRRRENEWPFVDENDVPRPVSRVDPILQLMPTLAGLPEPMAAPVAEPAVESMVEEETDLVVEDKDEDGEVPESDHVDRNDPPTDKEDSDIGLEEVDCEDFIEQFGVEDNGGDEDIGGDEDNGGVDNNIEEEDSDVEFRDDEEIPPPTVASDDEVEAENAVPNQNVNPDAENEDLLRLGKCFATIEDFKIAVLKYSLRTRYDIKIYRSEASRIGARCSDKEGNCKWRVYASYSKRRQKMQVTFYHGVHICVRSGYSKMLKQGAIAWLFKDRMRLNPKLTKYEMAEEVLREYNLVVSEEKCSKAKTYLAKQRKQSHECHFARVWDYQAEVLQSNEGSTLEIETVPGPTIGSKQRFHKLFMCFKSQKDAWKNTCRPILGFDGAFLKWDIKGHLLAAVGRDGDNRIVPIAWAVVEIESEDNWVWFVRLVGVTLGLDDGRNIAIISDKQKGLVKAIHTLLPRAEHRQCAKHIMDNWKRDSHDMELQRLFWKIARSYNQGEFSANMDALMRYNRKCYDTLLRTNPSTWSRAFFRVGSYCNDVLNNLCESFNRTIREARRKPLLEMLEQIRRQCMIRNEKRSQIAEKCERRFTKSAHAEIEKMVAGSQFCTRHMARNNLHEVEVGGVAYRVNMNDCTCGCRKWQLTGIPCVHAAAVIIGKKEKVEDYVHKYYTTEMWRKTYQDGIQPVQGEMMWPRVNRLAVLPPPWRKGNPGRPSNYARRKGMNETQQPPSKLSAEGRVMTCSKCKQEGHNKATCVNERVEGPPKKPRGRPRKEQVSEGQATQTHGQATQTQSSQGQATQASQRQATQVSQASPVQGGNGEGLGGWTPWPSHDGDSMSGFLWSVFS